MQLQNGDKTGAQADMQPLKDELHAALEFLNGPPKEAYADIGGAPQAPDHTQTGEAKQWQRKALQLLRRMQELIDALAKHGALPAAGEQHSQAAADNPSYRGVWPCVRRQLLERHHISSEQQAALLQQRRSWQADVPCK